MSVYTDKARDTAIECIRELNKKLARMKPTDSFDMEDICATMMYLEHFRKDLEREKRQA